jgi:CheY-like chemotaxis protein
MDATLSRRRRGERVLYLDDDESLVLLTTHVMTRMGYRISGFTGTQDALSAICADPDGFRLVVTDYHMLTMSGPDVAREIFRIRADLPVVLVSGSIAEDMRDQARQAGVRHLVQKPKTVEELGEVIALIMHEDCPRHTPRD